MKSVAADPRHIPSLDGIRAVSFGIVFASHAIAESDKPQLIPGMFGVTVFFFLSGFLISTLLLQEYCETHTLMLGRFYLRRCLRLLPPLYVCLGIVALLYALGLFQGELSIRAMLAYAFYAGNYYFASTPLDASPLGTAPFWSLAVEEHFYLLFPLLLLFLLRFCRQRSRVLILLGICAAVLAWRVILWSIWQNQSYIEHATDTRMDSLLFGCALALSRYNPWLSVWSRPRPVLEFGTTLICVVVLTATLLNRNPHFRDTIGYTIELCALAPLFCLAIQRSDTWIFRWLNSRMLTYIGTVSYSLYLVHDGLILLLQKLLPHTSWVMVGVLALVSSLVVAELLRRWIETPLARMRRQLHRAHADPALNDQDASASEGLQRAAASTFTAAAPRSRGLSELLLQLPVQQFTRRRDRCEDEQQTVDADIHPR
jgi:peptidoglycan/LPS O-acetylase OafA/YrhL